MITFLLLDYSPHLLRTSSKVKPSAEDTDPILGHTSQNILNYFDWIGIVNMLVFKGIFEAYFK